MGIGRSQIIVLTFATMPMIVPMIVIVAVLVVVPTAAVGSVDVGGRRPFGPPPGTPPPGVQIGQTFNILAVRIRYSF